MNADYVLPDDPLELRRLLAEAEAARDDVLARAILVRIVMNGPLVLGENRPLEVR